MSEKQGYRDADQICWVRAPGSEYCDDASISDDRQSERARWVRQRYAAIGVSNSGVLAGESEAIVCAAPTVTGAGLLSLLAHVTLWPLGNT
jgi:hypothetical protein